MAVDIGLGAKSGYSVIPVVSNTYTQLTKLQDMQSPESETDLVEVTSQDTANRFKDFIVGMEEGKEFSFDVLYEKVQHAALYALKDAKRAFAFQANDGSGYTCEALIRQVSSVHPIKDKQMTRITIKPTTKP